MAADSTNLSEEAQSLSRVPLFKRLEPSELEKLAEEIDQVNFKNGEVIFNEHDRGDSLYVVERGSVRIWVIDEDVNEVTLAELRPGEFLVKWPCWIAASGRAAPPPSGTRTCTV